MKTHIRYCFFQIKRSVIVLNHMLLSVLVLVACTLAGIWAVNLWFANAQIVQTITVGIVIPDDAAETKLITNFISEIESVKSVCSFEYMSEEQALEDLRQDEIQAAILLSEQFFEDVDSGINTPITVLFAKNGSFDAQQSLFRELLLDGVSYVQMTEAAVYAASDMTEAYQFQISREQLQDILSRTYIGAILNRGDWFENYVLTETGEMNLKQYYIVSAILLVLLIFGIFFGYLFGKENRENEVRLRIIGLGNAYFSAVKILVMTGYLLLLLGIGQLIAEKVCRIKMVTPQMLGAMGCNLLLAFSIAAFYFMIYSFANGENNGSVLLLGVNVIMFLLSGGIVPSVFLPRLIGKIGYYLPMSFWMQGLRNIIFGEVAPLQMLWIFGMGIIFALIGQICVCKNI